CTAMVSARHCDSGLPCSDISHRLQVNAEDTEQKTPAEAGVHAKPAWSEAQRLSGRRRVQGSALHEHQLALGRIDPDHIAVEELAGQDLLRQRILQLRLDRTLERAGAVHRIEADVAQQLEGGVADLDAQATLGQAL